MRDRHGHDGSHRPPQPVQRARAAAPAPPYLSIRRPRLPAYSCDAVLPCPRVVRAPVVPDPSQSATIPPSTLTSAPHMKDEPEEHRNRITSETSLGWAKR